MFNITGGEIIIVLLLALIVLGPDKLPDFIRRAGRVYGEIKKVTSGFQTEFRDAVDEPMREMRETANIAKNWFEEGRTESDIEDESDEDESDEADDVENDSDVIEAMAEYDDEGDDDDQDVEDDEGDDDDEGDEGDDDPNFYDENGTLLDAAAIARMSGAQDGTEETTTG